MPNIHPILVHFTIALFVASVILDLVGRLTKKESFIHAGWWNLSLAAFLTVLTVISGLLAESSLPHNDEVHTIMGRHETLGFITLGTIVLLYLWRLLSKSKLPEKAGGLFHAVGIAGIAVMLAGGYYGGEMVYTHGMGVAPMMEMMMAKEGQPGHMHAGGTKSETGGQGHGAEAGMHDEGGMMQEGSGMKEHGAGMEGHDMGSEMKGQAMGGETHEQGSGAVSDSLYVCPMHPEMKSDHPAKCPKCDMDMEKAHPDSTGAPGHDHKK